MTQKEAVKQYMKQYGSISSFEAFADLGITRLAAVIWELKNKEGLEIDAVDESFTNRYGKKSFYTRYSFPKQ